MMSLEEVNFKRREFTCGCGCGFNAVDLELMRVLKELREYFKTPVIVSSGCRCRAYNTQIGGSPTSKHMHAKAADIKLPGVSPDAVADYLEWRFPATYGIGRYNTWTHIDVRKERARWDKRRVA